MKISQLFYTAALVTLAIWFFIQAKVIIAPIFFAAILSVLVQPLVRRLQAVLKSKLLSFLIAVLGIFGLVGSVVFLLSRSVIRLFESLEIEEDIVGEVISRLMNYIPVPWNTVREGEGYLLNKLEESSSDIMRVVTDMISGGGGFLFSIILCLILTYFFLGYYEYFKEVIYRHLEKDTRRKWRTWVSESPLIIRSYFKGTAIVMAILGVANTLLFYLIGMENPVVWGLLVASFAFIPYVGTAIGLLIPFSYSILSSGDFIQPLIMIVGYGIIQQIEGNIITPKVVGDQVRINPLIALLATVTGGLIWGVVGAIIALPASGMLRLALLSHEETEVLGQLMGRPGVPTKISPSKS